MYSKAVLLALLIAYAEARFGQEQATQEIIAAVQGGEAGAAATIAGASISDLLGGANACDKLVTADQIVAELGGGEDAIAAAIAHVAAEKNTNPDANGNAQNVCADPALPATEELRGITPMIDPAVDVDGEVLALSEETQANPLDATGKSVFDLLVDAGLGDLVVAQDSAGGAAAGGAGADAGQDEAAQDDAAQDDAAQDEANQEEDAAAGEQDAADCDVVNEDDQAAAEDDQAAAGMEDEQAVADEQDQAAADQQDQAADEQDQAAADEEDQAAADEEDAAAGDGAATGDADFGLCTPTIIFEGGQNGRPEDEFTFQIADELARGGQGEALNPAIITNALCNQLINVCEANNAAVDLCRSAEEQALALGTRDKAVADTFNTAIGFDGAVTNPSGGPAEPPAAAEEAARMKGRKRALRFRA